MIKVENLVAHYDQTEVLHGISLEMRSQEITVIMGQSGCGKTTFLRHLVGLMKPTSGTVTVEGRNLNEMSEKRYLSYCRAIGVLFQSGGLFNSLTVGDNVAFPLREHTSLAEPVIDIIVKMKLRQVGLKGAESLMPSELSGGMRKRAGLARALAMDPEIIFLDEPTSGLDPIIAAGIDRLILRLRDAYRATVVVVSHDIESGMTVGDRLAIFRDGLLLEVGAPQEIRSSDDPYVGRFIRRQPDEVLGA